MAVSGHTSRSTKGSSRRGAWLFAIVAVILLATPTVARASIFDLFGMTARASAMGGAQGAVPADHAGVYYNPATLTARKTTHVGVAVQLIAPRLSFEQAIASARPAVLPQTSAGVSLGAVFPLGGKIKDRIALGLAAYLPILQATRYEAIDPATPQFYLYQSLPDTMVLAGAVAFEIAEWLSIGVGAQILASFDGSFDIGISVANRRVTERSWGGELFGELAPILGVWARPLDGLAFGLTYRDDISLDFSMPVRFYTEELGMLTVDGAGRGLYTPVQVNFAASWELPWAPLLIATDLTWARWSLAPPPSLHVDATFDTSGIAPDDPEIFLAVETVDPLLGAKDILIPHIGAELQIDDLLAVQAGYRYRPSPIPDQDGYASYADNATHTLSLGTSLDWNHPLESHEAPVSLDLFVQLTVLETRHAQKDPTQDIEHVGSWDSAGTIWNLGIDWRQDF